MLPKLPPCTLMKFSQYSPRKHDILIGCINGTLHFINTGKCIRLYLRYVFAYAKFKVQYTCWTTDIKVAQDLRLLIVRLTTNQL